MILKRHITPKQFEVIQKCLTSKRVIHRPSRRTGKTTVNVFIADIEARRIKNYRCYYFGLTASHVKRTVYPLFMDIAGRDFLDLKQCKTSAGDMQIVYKNGSKIYLNGTGNKDNFRGDKGHRFIVDEIQDQEEEFVQKVIEPMCLDYDAKLILSGTVKGLDCWVNDYNTKGNWEFIEYNTYEGGLIPHHILDEAKNHMSPSAYAQEILGKPIPNTGLVYADFTDENIVDIQFNNNLPCYISFDFNVNPMCAVIIQKQDNSTYVVVKEFHLSHSNTRMTADVIIDYLRTKDFKSYVVLTGDYTGRAKDSTADTTDWEQLEQKFAIYSSIVEDFIAIRHCRSKKRRYNLTNNAFYMNRLFVNRNCKNLIKEYRRFEMKENGLHADTKGDSVGHISDAVSYFPYNFLEIDFEF